MPDGNNRKPRSPRAVAAARSGVVPRSPISRRRLNRVNHKRLTTPRQGPTQIPVVGLGASAGGLSALKEFFAAARADMEAAFLVISHLDPTHESLLAETLSKHTAMKVVQARDRMILEAGRVYVIPPNRHLELRGARIRLTRPAEREHLRTPIDVFLRSLAQERKEKGACIILSGTGCDGSLGLRAVKDAGGLTMVQSPDTAEYDGMPRSAIATDMVDCVLPVKQMPARLVQYFRHPYVCSPADEAAETHLPPPALEAILNRLRTQTNIDFRCYKKSTLTRRIRRRMSVHQIEKPSDYVRILQENPAEVQALRKDMLIGVTSFFREPEGFHSLVDKAVVPLVKAVSPDTTLRVWVPGCATGEEAYSLTILFHEQFAAAGKRPRLQMFATDINAEALELARSGEYPETIRADVSSLRLRKFFTRRNDRYLVGKSLREAIVFAEQDLLADPPFSKLDLISCRNVMIYLEPSAQKKLLSLFHFALNPGGYLFLGSSETVGDQAGLFETLGRRHRVYRNTGIMRPRFVEFPIGPVEHRPPPPPHPPGSGTRRVPVLAEIVNRALLQECAPAAVLINRQHEILYLHGSTSRYLNLPTGELRANLLNMAPGELRGRLHTALQSAQTQRRPVVVTGVRLSRGDGHKVMRVRVVPVDVAKDARGLLLVTFEEEPAPPTTRPGGEFTPQMKDLEVELKATREELQGTIDDLEAYSEELKVSNEEVLSMNEELKSANEELETSKEELQSLNEELSTVNHQLQEKVRELESTTNDLSNLLSSTNIATLFLDRNLQVKRFTPATRDVLNLIPSDVGRAVADITLRVKDEHLLRDTHTVLEKLTPIEKEVRGAGNRWFVRKIQPYRTRENRIDGAVVTWTDVTLLKQGMEHERRLAAVLLDSNDALMVVDFEGRITAWNRGAERTYGYTEAEALGMRFTRLCPPQRRAEAESLLRRLMRRKEVEPFETQRVTRDGRTLDVWLTVTLLRDEAGRPVAVATTERDITERKRADAALRQSEERHRGLAATVVENIAEGCILIDERGLIESLNPAAQRIFGCAAAEVVGRNVKTLLPRWAGVAVGDGRPIVRRKAGARSAPAASLTGRRMDKTEFPVELSVGESSTGGRRKLIILARDVTAQRQAEEDRVQLEREILKATNAEQHRIGRELHDQLGQVLTGTAMLAESVRRKIAEGRALDADLVERLIAQLQEAHTQVRRVVRVLIPVEVEERGLGGALEELASTAQSLYGIRCTFHGDRTVHVADQEVATHLFRIAQEAISNAARHGRARHIRVHLKHTRGTVTLMIQDDGIGFSPEKKVQWGMGLRIMRYRADLCGATLQISAARARGTRVLCTIRRKRDSSHEEYTQASQAGRRSSRPGRGRSSRGARRAGPAHR